MTPELFKEFCEEYTREINRLRIEASSGLDAKQTELKKVERQIRTMIEAIKDGLYPVRTKALQSAFGMSLVNSTIGAKLAYIEAIDLNSSHGECRAAVSDCLAIFRQVADLDDRKQMWKLTQKQWAKWDFGAHEPEGRLTWMAVSELDFGVLGYLVENLTKPEREDVLQKAAINGSGVALAPRSLVHSDIQEGRLLVAFPKITLTGPGFHCLYNSKDKSTRRIAPVLKWLLEEGNRAVFKD